MASGAPAKTSSMNIRKTLSQAHDLASRGLEKVDESERAVLADILKDLGRFHYDLALIVELYNSFHRPENSRRSVGGDNGTANDLGISRAMVNKRIKELKLSPEDFRTSQSVEKLVARSEFFCRMTKEIARLHTRLIGKKATERQ